MLQRDVSVSRGRNLSWTVVGVGFCYLGSHASLSLSDIFCGPHAAWREKAWRAGKICLIKDFIYLPIQWKISSALCSESQPLDPLLSLSETTWWVPLPDNETSTFHERSCADRTNWVRPRGILNSTNSFVWNSLRSGFRNPVSVLRPTPWATVYIIIHPTRAGGIF